MLSTSRCRVAWAAAASTFLVLTTIWSAPVEKPFPPAPQWENLGSVDIVPCPKRIELSDAVMPLADARLLYLSDEHGCTAAGAGEIASRCVQLGGDAPPSSVVKDPSAALGTLAAPAIVIGYGRGRLPLPDLLSSHEGISAWDEEQGYIIATRKVKGHGVVVVWGREPVAALYGCVTLRHLLSRDRERVVLRLAQVVDWPDFKRRITSGFFGARKDTDADIASAMATAKRFIRRAALLKCNSITPSRHWSVRAKLDYLRECDLKLLERLPETKSKRRLSIYGRATKLYPQRADLVSRLYISKADYLLHLGKRKEAIKTYETIVLKHFSDGPVGLEALDRVTAMLKEDEQLDRAIRLHQGVFKAIPKPDKSIVAKYFSYTKVGQRLVVLLKEAGNGAAAAALERKLDSVDAGRK